MLKQHKGLGTTLTLPDEILQRHLVAIGKGMRAAGANNTDVSQAEYDVALCRVAINLGWVPEFDIEEVAPAKVRWIVREVNQAVGAATIIPPE